MNFKLLDSDHINLYNKLLPLKIVVEEAIMIINNSGLPSGFEYINNYFSEKGLEYSVIRVMYDAKKKSIINSNSGNYIIITPTNSRSIKNIANTGPDTVILSLINSTYIFPHLERKDFIRLNEYYHSGLLVSQRWQAINEVVSSIESNHIQPEDIESVVAKIAASNHLHPKKTDISSIVFTNKFTNDYISILQKKNNRYANEEFIIVTNHWLNPSGYTHCCILENCSKEHKLTDFGGSTFVLTPSDKKIFCLGEIEQEFLIENYFNIDNLSSPTTQDAYCFFDQHTTTINLRKRTEHEHQYLKAVRVASRPECLDDREYSPRKASSVSSEFTNITSSTFNTFNSQDLRPWDIPKLDLDSLSSHTPISRGSSFTSRNLSVRSTELSPLNPRPQDISRIDLASSSLSQHNSHPPWIDIPLDGEEPGNIKAYPQNVELSRNRSASMQSGTSISSSILGEIENLSTTLDSYVTSYSLAAHTLPGHEEPGSASTDRDAPSSELRSRSSSTSSSANLRAPGSAPPDRETQSSSLRNRSSSTSSSADLRALRSAPPDREAQSSSLRNRSPSTSSSAARGEPHSASPNSDASGSALRSRTPATGSSTGSTESNATLLSHPPSASAAAPTHSTENPITPGATGADKNNRNESPEGSVHVSPGNDASLGHESATDSLSQPLVNTPSRDTASPQQLEKETTSFDSDSAATVSNNSLSRPSNNSTLRAQQISLSIDANPESDPLDLDELQTAMGKMVAAFFDNGPTPPVGTPYMSKAYVDEAAKHHKLTKGIVPAITEGTQPATFTHGTDIKGGVGYNPPTISQTSGETVDSVSMASSKASLGNLPKITPTIESTVLSQPSIDTTQTEKDQDSN